MFGNAILFVQMLWAFAVATSLLSCPDLPAFLGAKIYHFLKKEEEEEW